MTAMFVYVTASTAEEAVSIGHAVVGERLAACANVSSPVTSVFRWQGEVQTASEVALVLKTRASLVEALVTRIRELHSYECPCVVALPIAAGNPEFLAWIEAETSSPTEP